MRLVIHPRVYSDFDKIMAHYEQEATPDLANEFYAEVRHFMAEAAARPESFSIRESDIRRVSLQRFLIIVCFASSAMRFGSSLFAIIEDIRPLA